MTQVNARRWTRPIEGEPLIADTFARAQEARDGSDRLRDAGNALLAEMAARGAVAFGGLVR